MEKLDRYRTVIHNLLAEYRDFFRQSPEKDVETEVVSDDANGQYLLIRVGWRGETRVLRALFYLRLKDGKVWIEEDRTQEGVANELVRAGVPQGDIVLAFNPPLLRPLTEFAAA
jgi:hypothetical protein